MRQMQMHCNAMVKQSLIKQNHGRCIDGPQQGHKRFLQEVGVCGAICTQLIVPVLLPCWNALACLPFQQIPKQELEHRQARLQFPTGRLLRNVAMRSWA